MTEETPPDTPIGGELMVGSLSQARKHKRKFDAVITLEDPACRPANRLRFTRRPAPAHLVLGFEDVDDQTLGVRVATREQVVQALEFGRKHQDGSLLVHCFHGVGRSAAVALAILADRSGVAREQEALDRLLTIRPQATPNLVVISLADEILGRRGRLIGAVAGWEARTPRLQEAREARRAAVLANPQSYSWL